MQKNMKRFVFFCVTLFAIIGCITFLAWHFKADLLANILAKHLKVPVSIQSLYISEQHINISKTFIGSVPNAQTPFSFKCDNIDIQTNLSQIQATPLTINYLKMDNITIGLEYFPDGSTNWSLMLNSNSSSVARPFQIDKLILQNITVIITKSSGQVTQYPTIPLLILSNINSADQPISEIEKAIFKIILQNVMQKLDILFNPQQIPVLNPLQNFPKW